MGEDGSNTGLRVPQRETWQARGWWCRTGRHSLGVIVSVMTSHERVAFVERIGCEEHAGRQEAHALSSGQGVLGQKWKRCFGE